MAEYDETLVAAVEEKKKEMEEYSSSSSSSSEEEEEGEDVENVEKALADNPTDYDTHVQYIKAVRKVGELDKLRAARESMSQLFPLSPSLWLQWVHDEASLLTSSSSTHAITQLYDRALRDYLSVPLWCDYLNFVQDHCDSSPAATSKLRDLFERALPTAGLHVTQGYKIWEAYIKFEQTILQTIDHINTEEKEKQVHRIRSLFHRQLSVPLCELGSVLLAYKSWEAELGNTPKGSANSFDGIPPNVSSSYQKAMEMYNARACYEEHISGKLHLLRSFSILCYSELIVDMMLQIYLKFEQSSGDPARTQILYERAVTEFPVSSDLWLDYTRYVDQTIKVPKIVLDIHARATRNCTWVGELWVRYLLALERAHSSEELMSTVFEQSLQCVSSSEEVRIGVVLSVNLTILFGHYWLLYTPPVDEWMFVSINVLLVAVFHSVINLEFMFQYLFQYLDLFLTRIDGLRRRINLADSTDDFLEYSVIRDTFQRATDYLSPHLKNTDGLLLLHEYWARLELSFGKDLAAVRGVWESLLKTSGSMFEAWKQYIKMEIETGHVTEARGIYKRCYSKKFTGTGSEDICHSWVRFEREFGTLDDYDHAVRKVTPRLEELKLYRSQQESKSGVALVAQKEDLHSKKAPQKRKMGAKSTEELPTSKRQKGTTHNSTKSFERETSQKSTEDSNVELGKPETMNEQKIKYSVPRATYTDQCTAKDEHLRDFFSDVGGVTAIRLLRDKLTGKSRGLAYVDLADDTHLVAALAKNKQILLGKKVSIARSDPKHKKGRESYGRSSSEHDKRGPASNSGGSVEGSGSQKKESVASQTQSSILNRHGDNIQLRGRNTFAVPRTVVRTLGRSNNDPKKESDETPKSNDEFRNLLLK
ncbi:hypothetical protein IFM89_039613 [Coptis chinensis]|uniref:RRM domain-containing protein n=1 Tax=Coptis chinensis TaxID=261450 RepID=A0A835GXT2_9MAGN|nr:hypothetical protein IFM89_039613 [Coptis chinensis]